MANEDASAPSIAVRSLQMGGAAVRSSIERRLEAERDQLALWLPVGLGLGIAAWFGLPTRREWLMVLLAAVGVALMAMTVWRGGRAAPAVALFAAVCRLVIASP